MKVYRDFIDGYLNLLRQKEKKPADWTPETLSIDAELADEMRHFFPITSTSPTLISVVFIGPRTAD
jgi:hypothetical protein